MQCPYITNVHTINILLKYLNDLAGYYILMNFMKMDMNLLDFDPIVFILMTYCFIILLRMLVDINTTILKIIWSTYTA